MTSVTRSRFSDTKRLKAYAGAAPITRASGKARSVTRRRVKNNRLNAACYTWAFSALTASPGARAEIDYCLRRLSACLGERRRGPSRESARCTPSDFRLPSSRF